MNIDYLFFKKVISLSFLLVSFSLYADKNISQPPLLLAKVYHADIQLENYWISEKYDGVRAYWNGENFVSRQGNIFHAPEWFKRRLPKYALDGELWLGHGMFAALSGLVRRKIPNHHHWEDIKYMVFDLPDHKGVFDERLKLLKNIVMEVNAPHIKLVKQFKVSDHAQLTQMLDDYVSNGAEGLMLHSASSTYKKGRSGDLLKLKKYLDAEAIVVSYIPGKGKYQGLLGSLEVEIENHIRFKIGSGFTDEDRKNPPAIGSSISYKYFGLTHKGIPRFASFMHKRELH